MVIAAWLLLALVLAPLQPKLQTIASDESQTFFTRGADSTQVDRALDADFPESRDATAVIAYVSEDQSIYTRSGEIGVDTQEICADQNLPDLKGVGSTDGADLRRDGA